MNKILTLILALTITSFGFAKDGVGNTAKNFDETNYEVLMKNYIQGERVKEQNSTQALNGKTIRRNINFLLSHYSTSTTPVTYDPFSNAFGIVISEPLNVGGKFLGMKMYMLRTTDNGVTFDSVGTLFQESSRGTFRPSISFVNDEQSSDVEDVSYIIYGPQNYTEDTVFTREGGIFVYYDKEFGLFEEFSEGPTFDREWKEIKLYSDYSENMVYGYSLVEKEDPDSQTGGNIISGDYGFWKFGFNSTDQTQFGVVPNNWTDDKFYKGTNGDGLYTSEGQMGTDEKGNLYNVINHLYPEDSENRVPGFSKSTDDGLNWSKFQIMPNQVYRDFATKFSGYKDFGLGSGLGYHPYALKVRGEDKFSFFTRILIFNRDDEELPQRYFIVEATYDNGVWGMNEIEELNSFGPPLIFDDADVTGFQPILISALSVSANGNNVQLTETADGKNWVLFYIDNVNNEFNKFAPYQVTEESTQTVISIDSLEKFDIYAKIYNVSEGTWSKKINLTENTETEVLFNVPHLVKDIENIPMLTYHMTRVNGIPNPIIDIIPINNSVDFIYHNVNLGNINSVENTLDFDVQLGDAYPNPAVGTDNVDISFTVEKPTMATIEMYDNMGNKVSTLLDQKVPAGERYINANISNLNSGTYYFQLNISGHTFTKKLVVVK